VRINFDLSNGRNFFHALHDFNSNENLIIRINGNSSGDIHVSNVIAFPGLTNSHDHLDFNLFPFLGNRIYSDYKAWGEDIHKNNKKTIEEVLSIPLVLRIRWGILKNLINGVTNIVHHGIHHALIRNINYPVILNYRYLHALDTEPYWKIKLNTTFGKDVMIHIGEGVTEESHLEIQKFIQWNIFKRPVIGVHAIAMDEEQARNFKAIVWCPDSNLRLYGKTANIAQLSQHTHILFGTDSNASASSDLWEQLRLARSMRMLTDEDLFLSLTATPSKIFQTSPSFVVAKRKSPHPWEAFFSVSPEDILLVSVRGLVVLADSSFTQLNPKEYTALKVGRSTKQIVNSLGNIISALESFNIALPFGITTRSQNTL